MKLYQLSDTNHQIIINDIIDSLSNIYTFLQHNSEKLHLHLMHICFNRLKKIFCIIIDVIVATFVVSKQLIFIVATLIFKNDVCFGLEDIFLI